MPQLPVFLPIDIKSTFSSRAKRAGMIEAAVGENHDAAHLLGAGEQAAGECDGLGDARRAVARIDGIERGAERTLVVGRSADDVRAARPRR